VVETFGEVLRSVREAAGMPLSALATRTHYSKSVIAYVETGRRTPHPGLAEACDRALGTTPLLSMLLDTDGRNEMRRRVLLANVGAALGTAGVLGAAALADTVRHGLLDTTGPGEDWDTLVAGYHRRLVVDPSPEMGRSVLASLMVARQHLSDTPTPDLLKAVAGLGQVYGLWLGNQGDTSTARNWYRTAVTLADRSGHTPTRVYTRGRAASRGIYEGNTVTETVDAAGEALALSTRPSDGAVEAWSALVHVHGLTGNLAEGRRAVGGMTDVADALPHSHAGPQQRTASFRNYLECRIGPFGSATTAHEEALTVLRGLPVWLADARLYYAKALIRHGDIPGGVGYALAAARGWGHTVQTLSVGVSDVLASVPAGYWGDDLDELRTFAHTAPGPWETVV